MLVYHQRRFDSTSVGVRVVPVVCDHCGCEYFYELARVGSGAAVAPYAIGSAGAARTAAEEAKKDLGRRLDEEAELVPCPKCLWINDEMVAGYRRGRCRGWTKLAAGVGIVGTAISLVGAWFLAIGPAADRGALPYVLVGGMTISMAATGCILLLRQFLRGRIQPNRDYPLAPRLPHGSPVALIQNPSTGELEPARTTSEPAGGAVGWADFQVGRDALPPVCCDCLAPAAPGAAYRHPVGPALAVVIPLCAKCARRWTGRKWLGALAGLGLAAVAVPVLMALKLDEIIFWTIAAVLALLIPTIGAMIAGRLASPVLVKIADRSRGVVRLRFRNESFLNARPG